MSNQWINLSAPNTHQNLATQSFHDALYQSRIQPAEDTEDIFGDLRSLLQRGFTGGEDWVVDWAGHFVDEKQQAQAMAYLSNYFGRPITTMDEASFEFDFFALKTLHQKMASAGLHKHCEQPNLTLPRSAWCLDVLSANQIMAWEETHQRTLPEPLKRVYLELFGGCVYAQYTMPTNCWLLDHITGPFPSLATLETILHRAGVESVDRLLSKIQYGINRLASAQSEFETNLKYAKIVKPQLRNALVLERCDDSEWDYISILVEFGPLDQHVIALTDVINDPNECSVENKGPLAQWLVNAYLNALLDLGV